MPRKSKKGWQSYGNATVARAPSYTRDRNGRARDASGRFLSKRSVSARDRAAKPVVAKIEREIKLATPKRNHDTVTFRIKVPKNATPETKLALAKQLQKAMKEAGVKERQKNVKFFGFVEGDAIDAHSKKKVRAGAGTGHSRSLKAATKETEDKIRALLEGKSLANDPFKTTGSGAQSMKRGPDTLYVTAIYFPGAKVPGLDFNMEKPKARKRKRT